MAHLQVAKYSGWMDDLIHAGTQIGMQFLPQILGGGGSGGAGQPARGLAAIQQATAQIIQAMEAILSQIGQGNYQQLLSQAQQLANALSDPSIIYQAKRGDDAAVLQAAKSRAAQILQQIAQAGSNVSPVNTAVNQTGQVIAAGGTTAQNILSNSNLLLFIAVGFGAIYLLKK